MWLRVTMDDKPEMINGDLVLQNRGNSRQRRAPRMPPVSCRSPNTWPSISRCTR